MMFWEISGKSNPSMGEVLFPWDETEGLEFKVRAHMSAWGEGGLPLIIHMHTPP